MNERTSNLIRNMNENARRDSFTPEQKAKNIATAFVYAQMRAEHPDLKNVDGYPVKLREDVPDNQLLKDSHRGSQLQASDPARGNA